MATNHSPLPWKQNDSVGQNILDGNGDLVACGYGACDVKHPDYEQQATENAALIARRVNQGPAFDAMVEALKKAEHELITLHNLDASDDAERLFRNPFTIDTSAAQAAVSAALKLAQAKS